ncbi:hypothetical protein TBLA_0F03970 [Henningerozyma blattae CBS 6284]|uniref:Peptidase S8/S53 domain-containing protein n=1 Tax=Henningerozyma blattae (strain ATCC 34711 / CBS 6284 / DSM 70876 / NBRC 10599 / NRRL Y-10934 / UCD 77-7) TaxID=1071380 RepID=I2H6C9_HENB6|nr:hypothetical protein TBLA_0F03970 [Tetrapisispora blattae CBS 6284]CCH61931.1 hypothetical protein TBLA_0F03970 [Tetrapisispora blattae CBS 6284]
MRKIIVILSLLLPFGLSEEFIIKLKDSKSFDEFMISSYDDTQNIKMKDILNEKINKNYLFGNFNAFKINLNNENNKNVELLKKELKKNPFVDEIIPNIEIKLFDNTEFNEYLSCNSFDYNENQFCDESDDEDDEEEDDEEGDSDDEDSDSDSDSDSDNESDDEDSDSDDEDDEDEDDEDEDDEDEDDEEEDDSDDEDNYNDDGDENHPKENDDDDEEEEDQTDRKKKHKHKDHGSDDNEKKKHKDHDREKKKDRKNKKQKDKKKHHNDDDDDSNEHHKHVKSKFKVQRGAPRHLARISTRDKLPFNFRNANQFEEQLNYYYDDNDKGEGVLAYVIDTGILKEHKDFEDRVEFGTDLTGEGAGDLNGHGTHVAGLIGSKTYGVDKKVKIIDVKAVSLTGSTQLSHIIEAIEYTVNDCNSRVDKKACVVNMSLGSFYVKVINEAVESAIAEGVVFVVAAGNNNIDACWSSPGSSKNAITVGAFDDRLDVIAKFSNWGECVDIFASGVEVKSLSSQVPYKYIKYSGTSMASPIVCGFVSILLSQGVKPNDVQEEMVKLSTKGDFTRRSLIFKPFTSNRILFNGMDPRDSYENDEMENDCGEDYEEEIIDRNSNKLLMEKSSKLVLDLDLDLIYEDIRNFKPKRWITFPLRREEIENVEVINKLKKIKNRNKSIRENDDNENRDINKSRQNKGKLIKRNISKNKKKSKQSEDINMNSKLKDIHAPKVHRRRRVIKPAI